ncbi:methyltransferase domain-containing protein [Planctomycetota bacterium]
MTSQMISILRCPMTKSPLRRATQEELRSAKSKHHADGTPTSANLERGLVSEDGVYLYPVEQGIAILLPNLAIVLDETKGRRYSQGNEQLSVQRFYDELGWTKQDEGSAFVDAERWEDLRPVSQEYTHRCHLRVSRYLKPKGTFFLDVASGPVQYPEYLTYSRDYDHRICVDISLAALKEARNRVGDRGVYLLADITNLPLMDDVIDAVVSLHTIYHVAAEEQASAFCEVHRVLRPGCSAVAVYSWGENSPLMRAAFLRQRLKQRLWNLARRAKHLVWRTQASSSAEPRLYYHAHNYDWFVRQPWPFEYAVHTWRSVSVPFLRSYVHQGLFGRQVLDSLYRLEEKHSAMLGRLGQYPLIHIQKQVAAPLNPSRAATNRVIERSTDETAPPCQCS